ncbi:MAG: DUF167 domain-containing protein [Candidatus Nomurabacteria bacterium]|jgi:uncharacterized protein (TIGR00251 family)|nr:DUF167 domain-containing protein [Candidatus Nomurabacteria bacterium]
MLYHITVKPNSRKGPAVVEGEDGLTVYVRAKAIDGAANQELVEVLAKHFAAPKTRITIKRGATGRHKTIEIS